MERKIFEPEHDAFRAMARRSYEKECLPHRQEWERDGVTSREVWLQAGELGLLGWEAQEKYGGQGLKDFRYNTILTEEKHATGAVDPGPAERRHGVVPDRPDHAGAEEVVGARLCQRRDHHRHCDVRAWGGLRPAGIGTAAVPINPAAQKGERT